MLKRAGNADPLSLFAPGRRTVNPRAGCIVEDCWFQYALPDDNGARKDKPPYLKRIVPSADWAAYLQREEKDEFVQISVLTMQFELIHPFCDGNGRIGRMLVLLILYEKGLIGSPRFSISAYLERHRSGRKPTPGRSSRCCFRVGGEQMDAGNRRFPQGGAIEPAPSRQISGRLPSVPESGEVVLPEVLYRRMPLQVDLRDLPLWDLVPQKALAAIAAMALSRRAAGSRSSVRGDAFRAEPRRLLLPLLLAKEIAAFI
ncbi:Fic family protein [Methanoculleus taiwanensis]|nr:Fic family protein [Methanoculleus taiwanensis]